MSAGDARALGLPSVHSAVSATAPLAGAGASGAAAAGAMSQAGVSGASATSGSSSSSNAWAWGPNEASNTSANQRWAAPFPGTTSAFGADDAVPRTAAKSPIGTRPSLPKRSSVSESRGLQERAFAGGMSLHLQDDAELQSSRRSLHPGKDLDDSYAPNLASLTASPLSTPSFPSANGHSHDGLMSPSSPSDDFASSRGGSSHFGSVGGRSQPPSRGEESFDQLEKSLTAMIFNNSSHSHSAQHSAALAPPHSHPGSAPQSVSYGAHPAAPGSMPFAPSPAPPMNLPRDSSPPGSVAYVVLPNGQVQTVSMATIMPALQGNATGGSGSGRESREGASANSLQRGGSQGNTPNLYPRSDSREQARPSSTQFYPQVDAYPESSDDLGFSLETLSTKTLPLFSPPTPPLPLSAGGSNSGLAPRRTLSGGQGSTTPSAYSSPAQSSMQNRVSQRGGAQQAQQAQLPPVQPQQQPSQPPLPRAHNVSVIHDVYPAPSSSVSPPPPLMQLSDVPLRLGFGPSTGGPRGSSKPILGSGMSYSHGAHSDSLVAQAKSQAGSRMLQTRLQANEPGFFASVFEEVYEALPELMVDLFGNYLVQKLITFANDTQRLQLLLKVLPELLEISCDRQGTRAIQKLIEALQHQHERQLVLDWLTLPLAGQQQQETLSPHIIHIAPQSHSHSSHSQPTSPLLSMSTLSPSPNASPAPNSPGGFSHPPMPRLIHLIRDQNGSHVVHSILDTFPQHMLHNIQRNAMKNCRSLGVDQHGLCVLKKALSMSPASDFIYFCLKCILEHIQEYVNNQYGNYLVQHIIERTNGFPHTGSSHVNNVVAGAAQAQTLVAEADEAVRPHLHVINDAIFRALRGSFARLSRQKFSSNVVEKCLKIPDAGIRSAIIAELIEQDAVAALLQCSYGNYVLQNVLYVASQEECALLLARVRPEPVMASLRKNIASKWQRILANAHLIHPGIVIGDGAPAPTNALLPLSAGIAGEPRSQDAPAGAANPATLYPTPQAIQLITSILGATTPSVQSGGDPASSPTGSERGTPGSSSTPASAQASPMARSMSSPLGGLNGSNSPNFPPRNVNRRSAAHTPNNFQQTSQGGRSGGHYSGPNSNAGSAVTSPYMGAQSSFPHRHQSQSSQSYSGSNSPMLSPNDSYRSMGAPSNSAYNSPSPYSEAYGGGQQQQQQQHQQQHHSQSRGSGVPGFGNGMMIKFLPSGGSSYPSNAGGSSGGNSGHGSFSGPAPLPTGGNLNLSTPDSIAQQIQNTQNQLQALMALQQAQAALNSQQQQQQGYPRR